MSDHPTTFRAEPASTGETAWKDRASLHRVDDGNGLFDSAKGVRSGTFAEVIHYLTLLPEADRDRYVIHKAGDREYSVAEALDLAARDDFPGGVTA